MLVNPEIDKALLDVRKGYRLLSLYQRRVLDLCGEIVGVFESTLNFYQWTPSLVNITPRRGTSPFSHWAWDFLPLYDFCVLYLPEGVDDSAHRPGNWMLAIRIVTDSGYPDSGNQPSKVEPDPRDFKDPTTCETTVRLYIYYCSEAFEANWYYGVYDAHPFPQDNGPGAFPFDKGVRTFGMKFSLSEMENSGAVQSCVDRFRTELRQIFPDQTTRW